MIFLFCMKMFCQKRKKCEKIIFLHDKTPIVAIGVLIMLLTTLSPDKNAVGYIVIRMYIL